MTLYLLKVRLQTFLSIPITQKCQILSFDNLVANYIYIYIYIYIWRVWGSGDVCSGFWLGNLSEIDHLGDLDVDERIILGWIFRKWEGVVGTGWSWLRIGTGGGHL